MKKYFLIIIILFTLLSSNVFAASKADNAGFLGNQIWYSPETFSESDTVNIYTAIWNGNENSLSVKVEFYDKNVILGSREINIPSNELKQVSIPWKVTSGDHVISAKIVSSTLTSGNSKESVSLNNIETSSSRKFVPVAVKTQDGQTTTTDQMVKDQINKVSDKINEVVPTSVSNSVSNGVSSVDDFRGNTLKKISSSKDRVEKKIENLNQEISNQKKEGDNSLVRNGNTLETATEKPIATIKLFFLKILKYIFSHKFVFYGLIVLIIFYFLRYLYRKIRYR